MVSGAGVWLRAGRVYVIAVYPQEPERLLCDYCMARNARSMVSSLVTHLLMVPSIDLGPTLFNRQGVVKDCLYGHADRF